MSKAYILSCYRREEARISMNTRFLCEGGERPRIKGTA